MMVKFKIQDLTPVPPPRWGTTVSGCFCANIRVVVNFRRDLLITLLYTSVEVFMINNTRACIAFIAVGVISGNKASAVYDYTQSKHIGISGNVDVNSVSIYDHDRGCYVSGNPSNLYDYGNSAHIQLKINDNQFSGYDYCSSSHFSGTVNKNSVIIYDYETSSHHNYSV